MNVGGDVRFHTRMVRKLDKKLVHVWTRRWRCLHPWTSKPIMPCETVRRLRKKIMDKHTLNKTSSCAMNCEQTNERRRTLDEPKYSCGNIRPSTDQRNLRTNQVMLLRLPGLL